MKLKIKNFLATKLLEILQVLMMTLADYYLYMILANVLSPIQLNKLYYFSKNLYKRF